MSGDPARPVPRLLPVAWMLLFVGTVPAFVAPALSQPGRSDPGAVQEPSGAEVPERSARELLDAAETALLEDRYGEAVEGYRALLERGHDGGLIHYNLGNAYLRQGELGRAVASYRRGLARLPRHGDLQANLAFARANVRDAVAPPEPSVAASTVFFWHRRLSLRELGAVLLVANLAFWGVLGWMLQYGRKEAFLWLAGASAVVILAAGGSLAVHAWWPARVAVVLPAEVEAAAAPRPDALVRFKLHSGTELRVEELRDGWVRIALPNGEQAWLERENVAVVEW